MTWSCVCRRPDRWHTAACLEAWAAAQVADAAPMSDGLQRRVVAELRDEAENAGAA